MDWRLASLEHDARQPRLVMEATGQADTKTRERTKGAAKAAQAMHEDNFSANRVDPDSTCSTGFGVKVEPSALSCRDDVVVENGAATPQSCLSPLEMRTTTAAGGLLPTDETSTALSTTFDHSTLWFCQTEETELQLHPPGTTAASGKMTCLLPPGGSLRQNQGKTGCSIQAVLKIVSAPARFWECGARYFVGRFTLGLDEAAAFVLAGMMTWASISIRETRESFTSYV